jgi:isocitrate lyase
MHWTHQPIVTDTKQNNDVSFTYGCLDPVMVTQMAKYLDTVYVSGWQCSSTASSTDEPGPDLADYPYVSSMSICEIQLH